MRHTAIKFLLGLGLLGCASFPLMSPASAQIVVVDGKYRIVEVDRAESRIGIASPDASPTERQNWLYIKTDTRSSRRHSQSDGSFRDESMSAKSVLDAAESRIGGMMKINGGRDFDGSINAKKIWM